MSATSATSATSPSNPAAVVNSPNAGFDIFTDPEQFYSQEMGIVQRPGVLRRILVTAAGTIAAGVYFGGNRLNGRGTWIKTAYAVLSAGVGINLGLYMSESRMDAVGAAAAFYAMSTASAYAGFTERDNLLVYEAAGALASGFAIDRYMAMQVPCPSQ
jgi:hypothetical protein